MELHNWGRYPKKEVDFWEQKFPENIAAHLGNKTNLIARGNGRCYGDSALSDTVLSTLSLNKMLAFDSKSGEISCQAGVLLSDVIEFALPQGFFLPVTAGTKFVTVGGAIAADIHGKNHHVDGSFIDHVNTFELLTPKGEILHCSRDKNTEIFYATAGGMGLTGVILKASFRLKKVSTAYINQKNIRAANLDEIMDLFEVYKDYTYSVAWLDCMQKGKALGRSVLMLGEHANIDNLSPQQRKNPLKIFGKLAVNTPKFFPSFMLNNWSIKLFNELYFRKNLQKEKNFIGDYNTFFYPLDAILNWNRMYGKNGFTQYQFVIPLENGKLAMKAILNKIVDLQLASFLTVLKVFGKSTHPQYLSFPMEGYTLAMDFKIEKDTFVKLNQLDKVVLAHGGRLYLAKDARMSEAFFAQTQPNLQSFNQILDLLGKKFTFESEQSKRLKIIN